MLLKKPKLPLLAEKSVLFVILKCPHFPHFKEELHYTKDKLEDMDVSLIFLPSPEEGNDFHKSNVFQKLGPLQIPGCQMKDKDSGHCLSTDIFWFVLC